MGLSVSPIIAVIVMQDLEIELLARYKSILFYGRYVDAFFMIISKNKLKLLLKFVNYYYPRLKFTHETENNNSINFLDVLVFNNEDRTVSLTYIKKYCLR